MGLDWHSYEVEKGHGLKHDPLLSIIGPRPIGWISTVSRTGSCNLAPFSFFNLICSRPPILGFAPNGDKDSVENVKQTGEFVWNLVTRPLAEAMNITSIEAPHHVDEFELAGLTSCPSMLIAPPRVQESPVSMECKVTQVIPIEDKDGTVSKANLILGQIVAVHISKHLIVEGIYDTLGAEPVLRGGSRGDYFELLPESFFYMERPGSWEENGLADSAMPAVRSQGQ